MKMFYITLNNENEAKKISMALLERQLAVCTNWFPIQCAYRWEGEIKQGNEIVLIVKTQDGLGQEIENIIKHYINYNNYIAEINVHSINLEFSNWLNKEVARG